MNEQLTQAQKLANAISYLRSKGKYIADQDCKFKPTRSDRAADKQYKIGGLA